MKICIEDSLGNVQWLNVKENLFLFVFITNYFYYVILLTIKRTSLFRRSMRNSDVLCLNVENAQHDGKIEQDKQKQCAIVDEDFDGVAVGGDIDGEAVFEGDE